MASSVFKVLRVVVLAAVILGGSYWLFNFLFLEQSYKGYVNGKIVHVRPPIKGKLKLNELNVGRPVKAGEVLGTIEDERAYELLALQQNLNKTLQVNGNTLASLQEQIANREAWLSRFGQESNQHNTLRVAYVKEQLSAAETSVVRAQVKMQKAQTDAGRYQRLADQGYAPRATAEQFMMKAAEAETNYKAELAKLQAEKSKLEAAKAGIQVDGSLTRSYSDSRRYEVESELYRLRNEYNKVLAEMEAANTQFDSLGSSVQSLRLSNVQTPVNGVVWNVDAYNNEYISAQQTVLEVLDCDHLWIDTFVDEKKLQHLDMKAPIKVKLLSHPEFGVLNGKVQLVRTGVGRVSVQEGAAIPNDKLKSQALIRIQVDWPQQPDPAASCYVGTSVKTEFQKKPLDVFNKPMSAVTFFASIF